MTQTLTPGRTEYSQGLRFCLAPLTDIGGYHPWRCYNHKNQQQGIVYYSVNHSEWVFEAGSAFGVSILLPQSSLEDLADFTSQLNMLTKGDGASD